MQQRLGIGENSRGREVLSLVRVSLITPSRKCLRLKLCSYLQPLLMPLGVLVVI